MINDLIIYLKINVSCMICSNQIIGIIVAADACAGGS